MVSTTWPGSFAARSTNSSRVGLVPFWVVVALVVAYLLLIGPGDYFLLRKVVRRMEWTWLSFPLIVLLFCVGAYVAAHRLKGDRVRVNQIDLVDVAVAADDGATSALVRGTSWMNVFSPRAEAFDFALQPQLPDGVRPPDATASVAWLGLPGRFLGGMDPRASNPVAWTEGYEFSPTRDAMWRRADPGGGDEEPDRTLDRPDGQLPRCPSDGRRSGAGGHDHQHARLPVVGLPAVLRRPGLHARDRRQPGRSEPAGNAPAGRNDNDRRVDVAHRAEDRVDRPAAGQGRRHPAAGRHALRRSRASIRPTSFG